MSIVFKYAFENILNPGIQKTSVLSKLSSVPMFKVLREFIRFLLSKIPSSKSRKIKAFSICGLLLFLSLNAFSHEIRPAYLQISQETDTSYAVLWKVPTLNGLVPNIHPELPEGFILTELSSSVLPDAQIKRYSAIYTDDLAGKKIRVNNLEQTLIDALIHIQLFDNISYSFLLQPSLPEEVIPIEPEQGQVAKLYFKLGVEHILIGIDHLLFVLGLVLILNNFKTLVKTITSFTIAHSITLGIASLGWFSLPQAPVEAVIALSILFLAKEYLRVLEGEESLTAKHPWLVAFIFGLLHGFGFAGALQEIGFPQQDIPLALFTFNVGVEAGQILFVAVVWLGLILIKKMKPSFSAWAYKVPPYIIGSVAAFWLIQRVWDFL